MIEDIYTGSLIYKDIEFCFVFSHDELQLIPPKEERSRIQREWIWKSIGNGTHTFGEPLLIEDEVLKGHCNETGQTMIFLPVPGSYIGSKNSVLFIELRAFIICDYDRDNISRMSFKSPEINFIHPVNQAFSYSFDPEINNGVLELKTNDFSSTTTEKKLFRVDGREIKVNFGISRGVSTQIGKSPLTLESTMAFEFEPTDNYTFLLRLWEIATDYIRYLCYRNNANINEIVLSSPYEDGKFEKFAKLYIIGEESEIDHEALKKKCFIKHPLIERGEAQILQDISENKLYLRHLPESYDAGHHIDASRFIMITAAFEWEFNRMHPDGLLKSAKRIEAEEKVISVMDGLISNSSGKEKGIYKFLKKLVGVSSLEDKVTTSCEELDDIVGIFGKRLYSINEEELVYSDVGKRLAEQRNHYAHGDIDKDFIGLALLDLIFIEYIIYAMQLKHYGIDDEHIRKAINDLFYLNFNI